MLLTHDTGTEQVRLRLSGYSLTELLATSAAIALVAAVAFAVLTSVQTKARLAICRANVGLISKAVLMYAHDHRETLPLLNPSPPPGMWWWYKEQVKRYVGLTGPSSANDKVFACPEDRGYGELGNPVPFCQSAKTDFNSYVFNGVNLPGIPNIAGWRLSRVRDPAQTLLVMEWTAHAPLSWHHSKTGKRNEPFYNNALNMVGFVDGHVDYIPIYYDGINPAYTRDPIGGYNYKYSGD
jgi:type II secretory pathway pseudopilin PulG